VALWGMWWLREDVVAQLGIRCLSWGCCVGKMPVFHQIATQQFPGSGSGIRDDKKSSDPDPG
jgi:hypothetical protein